MHITAIEPALTAAPAAPVAAAPPAANARPPDVLMASVAVKEAGEAQEANEASLEDAASKMERHVRNAGRSLQFRVDENSGRVVVSVRDPETGELIRQIPSESALKIAERLDSGHSSLSSLIIDGQA